MKTEREIRERLAFHEGTLTEAADPSWISEYPENNIRADILKWVLEEKSELK